MKYDIQADDCCGITIPYYSTQRLLYTGLFCIDGDFQYATDLVIISGDRPSDIIAYAIFWAAGGLDEVYEFSM